MKGRFAAVDVGYLATGGARAAMVVAHDLTFSTVVQEHTATLGHVADYRAGDPRTAR